MGNYFFPRRDQGDVDVAALLTRISRLGKRQEKENKELRAEIKELRAEIKAIDARILKLEQANEKAQAKIDQLDKKFGADEERHSALQRDQYQFKRNFQANKLATDAKLASIEQSNKECKAQLDELKNELGAINKKVKELQDRMYGLIEAFLPALNYVLFETFVYRMVEQALESTFPEERKRGIKSGFCDNLLRLLFGNKTANLGWSVDTVSEHGEAQ